MKAKFKRPRSRYSAIGYLRSFGFSDNLARKLGTNKFLDKLADAANWVLDKYTAPKVKIHDHDTWNMDHTLAHIIYPMLVQIREQKDGAPMVDNTDLPPWLRTPKDKYLEIPYEVMCARWEWVLDYMIWAMREIRDCEINGDDFEDHQAYMAYLYNIEKGTTLFGKYFRALWT